MRLRLMCALGCVAFFAGAGARAATWTQPTEEELKMTSQPQVPGAAAVILYREEVSDDLLHSETIYERVKILTVEGRDKYATVTVHYPNVAVSTQGAMNSGDLQNLEDMDKQFNVSALEARTIHADGTVVPFKGKVFLTESKLGDGRVVRQKMFTLPSVEVGSILEYRYVIFEPESASFLPTWYCQSALFARKQRFEWHSGLAVTANQRVLWMSTLPNKDKAVAVQHVAGAAFGQVLNNYTATVENIMPEPRETFAPPLHSLEQRIVFYYMSGSTPETFWDDTGRDWSREVNSFMASGPELKTAADAMVAGAPTDDAKLKKIYAAIMQMENTDFTRAHQAAENKLVHATKSWTAQNTLLRKAGPSDELAMLFVALARAEGLKAYVMAVVNRDRNIFVPVWLSFDQSDSLIAIVKVNGQEEYFDPGTRDCPYGKLQWMHTGVTGLRQTDKGTDFATTPMGVYGDSVTQRSADMTLDTTGRANGTIIVSLTGAPALELRQMALRSDEAALKLELEDRLKKWLPTGAEVDVTSVDNLADYEKPLVVHGNASGNFVRVTAKRAIVPTDLFEAKASPLFPEEKRESEVYFRYPERVADAVRWKMPPDWEAVAPEPTSLKLPGIAAYKTVVQPGKGNITLRREYVLGEVVAPLSRYSEVRTFYGQLATTDQKPTVFEVR